jgi:hypothetical protein
VEEPFDSVTIDREKHSGIDRRVRQLSEQIAIQSPSEHATDGLVVSYSSPKDHISLRSSREQGRYRFRRILQVRIKDDTPGATRQGQSDQHRGVLPLIFAKA